MGRPLDHQPTHDDGIATMLHIRRSHRHGRRKGDGLIDAGIFRAALAADAHGTGEQVLGLHAGEAAVHLSRAVSGSQPEGAPFMLKVKPPLLGVSFMAFLQLCAGEQPAQEGEPLY